MAAISSGPLARASASGPIFTVTHFACNFRGLQEIRLPAISLRMMGSLCFTCWRSAPKFYYSTDEGHTFTDSSQFSTLGPRPEFVSNTSLAVNPNAEGDVWLTDSHSIFHSLDGGATWTKLSVTGSIWGDHPTWSWPVVYGATSIALGKAPAGASYSASVYVVGVINGVWGVHRSDDGGTTWRRFNDDKHQYGGIGVLAADQTVSGRLYMAGSGRGILFSY